MAARLDGQKVQGRLRNAFVALHIIGGLTVLLVRLALLLRKIHKFV